MPTFTERLRSFLINKFLRAQREVRNRFFVPTESFAQDIEKAHGNAMRYLDWRRKNKRQSVEQVIGSEKYIAERFPDVTAHTLADAERILGHTFNLLGSGPFTPQDPDRAARPSGYKPIDWYFDPVRKLRFPVKIPFKEWKLYEMRPENADVKYPWELSRSQHFATLGQAWRLSRHAKYAREIFDQISDFMEANPTGFGVNWTCTMDVAIRAGNWAIALAMTLDCDAIGDDERADAYGALFDHGKFIYENLENTYEVTSNHFLANVIGLHFIASDFIETPQGQLWDEFCRKALEREIIVQLNDDGSDYESAVPYHRLVAELFLASGRLAQTQGRPLSQTYDKRLAAMIEFLIGVQRPDGLMPVIGDADDGRYQIMACYGDWNRQDARHIYAPSALALNRHEWLAFAGPDALWEAAWWGFDIRGLESADAAPPDTMRNFDGIGIAVVRTGGEYLAITNGMVGTKGFGNHKHNELLGFEYHAHGMPLFVDAGSHVYTSDFASRNRFRSTAIHNTLMVNGAEQNETNPEWIFRLFESANPKVERFDEKDGVVTYVGSHTGYERIDAKATHRRTFIYNRTTGALRITDEVTGAGAGQLRWHFHAAPGASMEAAADHLHIRQGRIQMRMKLPQGLTATVSSSHYSPSYGVIVPCMAADISAEFPMDGRAITFDCTVEKSA